MWVCISLCVCLSVCGVFVCVMCTCDFVYLWVRGERKGVPWWNMALPTNLQLLHGHLLAMFLAALNENVQGVRVVFALGTLQLLTDSLL